MDPMIGTIILWGPNFAPRGWAFCHGQLLPIAQYTAVYSLLGTIYGGDGRSTFALPDLRGRVPVGVGTGSGLANIAEGQKLGVERTTLTVNQMPNHTHNATMHAETATGTTGNPTGNLLSVVTGDTKIYAPPVPADEIEMSSDSITVDAQGGNQSFDQHQPSLGLNYIIALEGVFPSRS